MKRMVMLSTVALMAVVVLGPQVGADDGFKNKYSSPGATKDCGDGDRIDYAGPLEMWPPNHKLQDVSASATDSGGDGVTIMVTVSPMDAIGGDGGPNHDPDFFITGDNPASGSGSATVPFQLRSERSGRGDDRTYDVRADATFDDGTKMCSFEWQVVVPHDMRGGRDW